jgi:hypothetical protein
MTCLKVETCCSIRQMTLCLTKTDVLKLILILLIEERRH